MFALYLFIKILLGACLRRLDQAQNMIILEKLAMNKTRNTGTGNGMWGTQGMGGMLYSGECRQTFWGMSPNIPGNVAKCPQTFQGMSSNIPGNVANYFGKCRQIFWGMPNIRFLRYDAIVFHFGLFFALISP